MRALQASAYRGAKRAFASERQRLLETCERAEVNAAELLRAADAGGLHIVTTKQARFAHALLTERAGVDAVPLDRIFSMTASGLPKTTVLAELQRGAAPGEPLRFVEDKLSALEKVCADPALAGWELLFVDWGFNTPAERARADAHPRIRLVGLEEFCALLAAN